MDPRSDMALSLIHIFPDGFYRLFLIYKSYHAGLAYNDYINLLQKKSVKVLLDEVYEPHFAHYHEYFGNTIAGFFSDEPGDVYKRQLIYCATGSS